MGASAVRITAADFLTPPELQSWQLAGEGSGRIGGLRLELVGAGGQTTLGGCYQQVPLRVLPPFRLGADQPALIYLLNPTAGLMDGDAQRIDVTAGPGTWAVVTGQSATRVHPCWKGFATQQWHIDVGPEAILVVLPGPTIPFQGCRYYQRATIQLAPTARLIWGDIWLAGRYARGDHSEQFQFATLCQDLTVRRAGNLIFRDRFCWRGPWDEDTASWHFGGHPAVGTLLVAAPQAEALASELPDGIGAAFRTAAGDLCLRWQSASETVITALVQTALHLAARLAGRTDGSTWLPTDRDLAPNHWFALARPPLATPASPT